MRGYTFTRSDFVREFGAIPLLSSDPVPVATRQSRFRPPYEGFYSRLGSRPPSAPTMSSGASATVMAHLDDSEIRDIAVSDQGEIWTLDWNERVMKVGAAGTLTQVNNSLPRSGLSRPEQSDVRQALRFRRHPPCGGQRSPRRTHLTFTCSPKKAVCCSGCGKNGATDRLDLFDVSLGDGYVRPFGGDGFRVVRNESAYIATGPTLLKVDLTKARWEPVSQPVVASRG